MTAKAALFPGQGSQKVGMGNDFFDNSDLAKDIFKVADKALGYDLSKLCFEGPIESLTSTENAQPALLTLGVLCYEQYRMRGGSVDMAAGHSLGEYSALVVAGVIEFEDAVVMVHKRGKYMQEAVPKGKGGMIAVMGPSEDEIKNKLSGLEQGVAEIANLNCPGQTVIAGDTQGIEKCSELMKELGAKVIPLNVSAPFHCSLMKDAELKLAKDIDSTSFRDPSMTVYANVTADKIASADEAKELLKRQVCSSVRWTDSIQGFVEKEGMSEAIEFGPGGVLTKLLKRIDSSVTRHQVYDVASLEQVIEANAK